VLKSVEKALGFDRCHGAVLVGAGRLGGALLDYSGFAHCGLEIRGVFDSNPDKVGTKYGGFTVQPSRSLEAFIRKHKICLAVITVPADAAQEVAELTVRAGVCAIWNFAPAPLRVPESVVLRNENLSVGLAVILAKLAERSDPAHRGHCVPRKTTTQ
jgi:redox-sensing transcriptional repressor